MQANFQVVGVGHCVGSRIVSNCNLATSLGLELDWFEARTGILRRRVCAEGENVLSLGVQAIKRACGNAKLDYTAFGHETLLIHIQNGMTYLTPPSAIVLSQALEMYSIRALSLDGVCSEPINALEIASVMLQQGLCERAIISASVDFISIIDPKDKDTVGLFGAGAGAMVLEKSETSSQSGLRGIYWETQTKYWNLGVIPVLERTSEEDGVRMKFGYYQMKGSELARIALKSVPRVIGNVLKQAAWDMDDVDYMVTHQPNVKMLEMGLKKVGFPSSIYDIFGAELGNMGPASLLVALSMAKEQGKIREHSKVLLLSFGLGFSCSSAALVF